MINEKMFEIEHVDLLMKCSLIDYNDMSIYFVCEDNLERNYICLCYDIDQGYYIIERISKLNISRLLNHEISMREVFFINKMFCKVETGQDFKDDYIEFDIIDHLDKEILPLEGAFYDIYDSEVEEYRQKIDTELLDLKNGNSIYNEVYISNFSNKIIDYTTSYRTELLNINKTILKISKDFNQKKYNSISFTESDMNGDNFINQI